MSRTHLTGDALIAFVEQNRPRVRELLGQKLIIVHTLDLAGSLRKLTEMNINVFLEHLHIVDHASTVLGALDRFASRQD